MNFYKNKWKISRYPETERVNNLISWKDFFELIWNNPNQIDYSFSKNFFENFKELFVNQTLPALWQVGENENCEYSDTTFGSKNSYLTIVNCFDVENLLYSYEVGTGSKNVINWFGIIDNSENIYFCSWIVRSFNVFYSKFLNNCNNIWFSSSLVWCSECILCNELQNQSFCIENKQYSKEEYLIKKALILEEKKNFMDYYNNLNLKASNTWSSNCTGTFCVNSNNIENGYFVSYVNNWRNLISIWWDINSSKQNLFDIFSSWSTLEDAYACMWVSPGSNFYCCMNSWDSHSIYYSYYLVNCSFCLGCIGLKNKRYCILNKQYSKEEWYELAGKIFEQMEKDWILWEFFPGWLNPFYFNDSVAYIISQIFTKEEVTKDWYLWRDEPIKVDIPNWVEIINSKDLANYEWFDSEWNWRINPEILKKAIQDENWNIYRIVKMEYDFLTKYNLPLPRIHWLDRFKLWFSF